MNETKWYLRTQDETFGPETESKLIEWARMGRIQPGQEISDDNDIWLKVEEVPFLDMRFSIDIGDGNPRGPFNKVAAESLLASGRLPAISKLVEVRAPFEEPAEAEAPEEEVEEPQPEQEQATEVAEVSVPEVVEKIVEVPVEKIVEKEVVKEVRVEVPVEKVVEKVVEKIIVDETRVKELEELLAEERRHTGELQVRMDENSRKASEAAKVAAEREANLRSELQEKVLSEQKMTAALKDAIDRENKYVEQIQHLEDELRRLPQAASEVADIQAAMYGLMLKESEDIVKLIEVEKREFEEMKRRYMERSDRLVERRRELLKRSGDSVSSMTRKALIERPEDPRTTQLRKELDELRRASDHSRLDYEAKIRDLSEQLRIGRAEYARMTEGVKDITQLRAEAEQLREQLKRTEKDLLSERQKNEVMQQQQAISQQALMARLATLESPSIGTSRTMETNQSREAKMVKLPGWMRLRK